MTILNASNLQMGRLVKVAFAILTVVLLANFGSVIGAGNILNILEGAGVSVVPGLVDGLSTVSTVYGAQAVFLSFLGVTVAPWIAAAVVGVGVAAM